MTHQENDHCCDLHHDHEFASCGVCNTFYCDRHWPECPVCAIKQGTGGKKKEAKRLHMLANRVKKLEAQLKKLTDAAERLDASLVTDGGGFEQAETSIQKLWENLFFRATEADKDEKGTTVIPGKRPRKPRAKKEAAAA